MAQLQCVVVTPETTVLDKPAEFAVLPLYDGEIGLAPGHSPLIGRLGFGEMRITSGGQVERYYVDGGFVQMADNLVSVLTGRAIKAAELDSQVASEQLAAALARVATGDEAITSRDTAAARARAQVRIARRGQA